MAWNNDARNIQRRETRPSIYPNTDNSWRQTFINCITILLWRDVYIHILISPSQPALNTLDFSWGCQRTLLQTFWCADHLATILCVRQSQTKIFPSASPEAMKLKTTIREFQCEFTSYLVRNRPSKHIQRRCVRGTTSFWQNAVCHPTVGRAQCDYQSTGRQSIFLKLLLDWKIWTELPDGAFVMVGIECMPVFWMILVSTGMPHSQIRILLSSEVEQKRRLLSKKVTELTGPKCLSYSWTISPLRASHCMIFLFCIPAKNISCLSSSGLNLTQEARWPVWKRFFTWPN